MPTFRKATWLHDYSISAHTEQIETTSLLPEYEPNPAWSDSCASPDCLYTHQAAQNDSGSRNYVTNAKWVGNDDDPGDGWWECVRCGRVLDTAAGEGRIAAFLPMPGTPSPFRTFVPGMTEVTVTRRSDGASWSGGAAGLKALEDAANNDDERAFVAALDHSSMFQQLSTGVQRFLRSKDYTPAPPKIHAATVEPVTAAEIGLRLDHGRLVGTPTRPGRFLVTDFHGVTLQILPATVGQPIGAPEPTPDEIRAHVDAIDCSFTTDDVEDEEMRVHHERRDPKHDLEIVTAMLTGMLYGAAFTAIARWLRRGRR